MPGVLKPLIEAIMRECGLNMFSSIVLADGEFIRLCLGGGEFELIFTLLFFLCFYVAVLMLLPEVKRPFSTELLLASK